MTPPPQIRTLFVILCIVCSLARGEGVFVYKNQPFHSDDVAYAIRYDTVERNGFVTWVTTGGKRVQFDKTQFHIWAESPTRLPNDITTPEHLAALSLQYEELEKLSKRFSKAAPLAKPGLTLLGDALAKLRQGLVRSQAKWISRDSYEKQVAASQAEIAAQIAKGKAERMAQEQRELEVIELKRKLEVAEATKARQERERNRLGMIKEVQDEIKDVRLDIEKLEKENISIGRLLADLASKNYE